MVNGTIHAADAVACGAESDLTIAYNDAAGRAPTTTFSGPTDLGGTTLVSGVYKSPSSLAITGTLTLDAQGDPNAVFIFQAGSTVITAPNSQVGLINGAQACNVFWQVGSSATLGVGSTFVGTILALTSITTNTNATVAGRLLARNGAVTLDSNTITRPVCAPPVTTTTTSSTSTTVPATTTTTSSTSTTVPATTTTVPATTTTVPATTTTTSSTSTTTLAAGATTTTVAATTSTTASITTTTMPSTTTTSGAAGATSSSSGTGTGSATGVLAITGRPLWWKVSAGGLAIAAGGLMIMLTPMPPVRRQRRVSRRGRHHRP